MPETRWAGPDGGRRCRGPAPYTGGGDPCDEIQVPAPAAASPRHAGPGPPGARHIPVGVVVARAARGNRPLTLTGTSGVPARTGALRAAEVTNGCSDGGAVEPFH